MRSHPELAAMNVSYRFLSLETFLSDMERIGFRTLELWCGGMHQYLDWMGFDPADRVAAAAAAHGMRIACICPEQNNPKPWNMAARDGAARERTLSYFERAVDLAIELGAGLVTVTGGWAFLDEPRAAAWERAVEMLARIAGYAGARGVRLVLEALQRSESILVNTAQDVRRMIDEVGDPALACCLDTGAMARAGDTIEGYFEVLGDRVAHAHLVDVNARNTHLAWGDGDRDLRSDLDALARVGYRGICTAEICDARYLADPAPAFERTMRAYRAAIKQPVA